MLWSWAFDLLTKINVGCVFGFFFYMRLLQIFSDFWVSGISTLICFPSSLESVCSSCGLEMRVPDSHFSVFVIDWKSQWINLS